MPPQAFTNIALSLIAFLPAPPLPTHSDRGQLAYKPTHLWDVKETGASGGNSRSQWENVQTPTDTRWNYAIVPADKGKTDLSGISYTNAFQSSQFSICCFPLPFSIFKWPVFPFKLVLCLQLQNSISVHIYTTGLPL